jgi:hypothetical protein
VTLDRTTSELIAWWIRHKNTLRAVLTTPSWPNPLCDVTPTCPPLPLTQLREPDSGVKAMRDIRKEHKGHLKRKREEGPEETVVDKEEEEVDDDDDDDDDDAALLGPDSDDEDDGYDEGGREAGHPPTGNGRSHLQQSTDEGHAADVTVSVVWVAIRADVTCHCGAVGVQVVSAGVGSVPRSRGPCGGR